MDFKYHVTLHVEPCARHTKSIYLLYITLILAYCTWSEIFNEGLVRTADEVRPCE